MGVEKLREIFLSEDIVQHFSDFTKPIALAPVIFSAWVGEVLDIIISNLMYILLRVKRLGVLFECLLRLRVLHV